MYVRVSVYVRECEESTFKGSVQGERVRQSTFKLGSENGYDTRHVTDVN